MGTYVHTLHAKSVKLLTFRTNSTCPFNGSTPCRLVMTAENTIHTHGHKLNVIINLQLCNPGAKSNRAKPPCSKDLNNIILANQIKTD